jgi:beta-glucosidase
VPKLFALNQQSALERFILVILLGVALVVPSPSNAASFPPHFKWCVATSAHQIEGGNTHSDWWAFEQIPGAIADGQPSGVAADHWNRLEQDTELLADLHVQQYRFSVEWAKIQPAPDVWSTEAIDHYRRELALLRKKKIEPLITLHHFTLPLWVAERGGFEWKGLPEAFEVFVTKVFQELGDGVETWMTFNEPQVVISAGYIQGVFPPQKKDLKRIDVPTRILLQAHARAYHRLHELARARHQHIRVGVAHHLRIFDPASSWSPLDWWTSRLVENVGNWSFPDAIESGTLKLWLPGILRVHERIPELAGTQDFLGLNYYSRDLIRFNASAPGWIERLVAPNRPVTDLNWEIYPRGLYRLIKKITSRYERLPILITENGAADHSDRLRKGFIREHLHWLQQALNEGARVENYCHWSLLDNYEWAEGFKPRFGLYAVDYATQKRTLRPSGEFFSRIAETHELPQE